MADGTDLSLSERIGAALELVPPDEWEQRIGRSGKQLVRYADGDDPPFSVLTALSVASGVPVDWLATGRATDQPGGLQEPAVPRGDFGGFVRLMPVWPDNADRPSGTRLERWTPSDLAFSEQWLKDSFDLSPATARYAVVTDHGMAPLCDTGATVIVEYIGGPPVPGIYVVRAGGSCLARRLYIMPDGQYELTADADPHWRFRSPDGAGLPEIYRIVWVARPL